MTAVVVTLIICLTSLFGCIIVCGACMNIEKDRNKIQQELMRLERNIYNDSKCRARDAFGTALSDYIQNQKGE